MLYFRVDMNEKIATGHVMRCLSIADAARKLNEDSTFIVADDNAVSLIMQRGYKVIVLNTQWNQMEKELDSIAQIIQENHIICMLVDSYQVTKDYLKGLKQLVKVVYLDDLNAFQYPVDGLICYANYYEKFDYPKYYNEAKLMLGTLYVPLREVFCNCKPKKIENKVSNLLLMSGGTDPYDVSSRILEQSNIEKYNRIDVICGKFYPNYQSLCIKWQNYTNVHIHQAVTDIEKYMVRADLAVSAGGSTLYELSAIGTPTISYSFADNQIDNVRQFQMDGLIDYAGDARFDGLIDEIMRLINRYSENFSLRQTCSIKMQNLVDGKGAFRIAKELQVLSMEGVLMIE